MRFALPRLAPTSLALCAKPETVAGIAAGIEKVDAALKSHKLDHGEAMRRGAASLDQIAKLTATNRRKVVAKLRKDGDTRSAGFLAEFLDKDEAGVDTLTNTARSLRDQADFVDHIDSNPIPMLDDLDFDQD